MINNLLLRQIQKYCGGIDKIPENFKILLHAISESYDHYDKDRNMLEHSIDISSHEMIELNDQLRKETLELKAAHHELKTLFENIDDVFFSVDMIKYQLLQISPSCETMFGYSIDDFFKTPNLWYYIIFSEDKKIIKSNYPLMNAGKRFTQEYRVIKKEGVLRWIETKISPTLNSEGKLIRIDGISSDITEKVLAKMQIEFDRRNRDALINSTDDLIWSVDKDVNLITANRSFLDALKKMTNTNLVAGDSLLNSEIFPKEFFIKWKNCYRKAISGETFIIEDQNPSPFGGWSEVSFHPIFKDDKVIGVSCFARNITQRKKAEQEILQKNNKLRDLSNHLQHIREEERTRIAREIHDELGQQLTALKMDIAWIMYKQNNPDEVVVSKLQEMLQFSDGLISTIRRISSDLRPAIIDDLGLLAALEWKCNDFEEKTKIPCQFVSSVKERRFDNNLGIAAYRILQETLTNVIRHAVAKSVTVSVSENETKLFIEVTDDGKGICTEKIRHGKTLGVIGMKERAALLGGELIITGKQNKGTHIKLILPIR